MRSLPALWLGLDVAVPDRRLLGMNNDQSEFLSAKLRLDVQLDIERPFSYLSSHSSIVFEVGMPSLADHDWHYFRYKHSVTAVDRPSNHECSQS